MESRAFDTLTRRASVLGLGAAGLGTFGPLSADAKKKKKKNKKKGDVNKLCKKQVEPCELVLSPQCEGDPECIAATAECCALLAVCDFTGLIDCINALQNQQDSEISRFLGQ